MKSSLKAVIATGVLLCAQPALAGCNVRVMQKMSNSELLAATMQSSDVIGFARILPPNQASPDQQELEVFQTLKGQEGSLLLARWRNGQVLLAVEPARKFEGAVGDVVPVALQRTSEGYVIPECNQLQARELQKRGVLRAEG